MARLYVLLFLVQVVLAVCALISCLAAEEDDIRALPRIIWVLIILLFPLVGSIAWFLAGRPAPTGQPGGAWLAGGARPARRPTRSLAPDDDPEFLRSLGERAAQEQQNQDQEMFRRWEEDLRRREEDLRRRETGDPPREEKHPEA